MIFKKFPSFEVSSWQSNEIHKGKKSEVTGKVGESRESLSGNKRTTIQSPFDFCGRLWYTLL